MNDSSFDGVATAAPSGRTRNRVTLLCEEDVLGQAIAATLTRDGAELTRAPCAAGAIETLRAAPPDVIVLESRSHDAIALGLCQAIRQSRELDQVKLLLLQDSGRPIDRRRASAMGADGFLAMPFAMAALRNEVGRLLGG